MKLDFGQPIGALTQFAYVVEDIDRAMLEFAERLGIGPWFVLGPFRPPEGRYRGRPTSPLVSLARAFTGHAMVEVIAQHDDTPSIWHEGDGPRRYGFHHWATVSTDFDRDVARYQDQGWEEAFYDRLPYGSRVVYLDTTDHLPGFLEIVEYTAEYERLATEAYLAAVNWDGRDPIRRATP
jgi:hypothetical protein